MSAVIDRNACRGEAHRQLVSEFMVAIMEAPESTVFTPAWNQYRATVAHVIDDEFCADDKSLLELLRIVRNAAQGVNVELQAQSWIAAEAKRFAHLHETARADELSGESEWMDA